MDQPLMTRRYALRLLGGAALTIPAGLALAGEARAARAWCRRDPVVELRNPEDTEGNTASIYLLALAEEFELNNSSCDVVVEHPKDAKSNKLWEDPNGYFGQGLSTNFAINEHLRFSATGMDVRVRLYVPASRATMRVRLEFAPGPIRFDDAGEPYPAPVTAWAEGTANRWITLQSRLPYADYR